MFGNVLSKLFSKSAGGTVSKLASQYGDDVVRNLASQYGDDVARNTLSQIGGALSPNYADDVARTGAKLATTTGKSKLGDALVKGGEAGLNAPMSITRKGMREIGDDAPSLIRRLSERTGTSDINSLDRIGKSLTGGKDSIYDEVTDALRSNLGRGNNVDLNDLAPTIRELRDSFPDKIAKSEIANADPIKLEKIFRSEASSIRKSATPTPGQKLRADKLDEVGREIASRIDGNIDPKLITQSYDDLAENLTYKSREALLKGDKTLSEAYKREAKRLAETPLENRSIQGLRSDFKREFVDFSKMMKLNSQSMGGGSMSRAVKDIPVVGGVIDATLSQPMEKLAQKAGETSVKLGRAFQSGKAQDVLKKGAAIGGGGLVLASLMGNNGNDSQLPQGGMMTGGGAYGGVGGAVDPSGSGLSSIGQALSTGQLPQEEPTVGGYTRSQLEDGYVQALMAGDAKSADAIGSIIDIMNNNEKRTATTDNTDDATKKRQAGLNTLNTLLQSYERGGGGQGIIGGTLTNLLNTATGGAYNSSAETYAAQARGAAAQIIKALGESGTLSDRDIQAAMDMLPKNTDTDKVAREKISNLMTLLGQ